MHGSLSLPAPSLSARVGITHALALACATCDPCVYPCPAGIMLGRMGESGAPLVSFCQCLNECVMKIVAVAVW